MGIGGSKYVFFFCLSFLLIFLEFFVFSCKGKENTEISGSMGIFLLKLLAHFSGIFGFQLQGIGALRPKNMCVNFINFSEAPNLEGFHALDKQGLLKEKQEITIEKAMRNKRKCITAVKGLQLFGNYNLLLDLIRH
ncbi:uncharacterized protein [Malus domestica]|uniref:uncharacterized protein isoform X6 n=1 Tax=Malus domestica TaxID=3750 RepID=UPI003974C7D0